MFFWRIDPGYLVGDIRESIDIPNLSIFAKIPGNVLLHLHIRSNPYSCNAEASEKMSRKANIWPLYDEYS